MLFDPYDREESLIFAVLNVPVLLLTLLFIAAAVIAVRREKTRLEALRTQPTEPIQCQRGEIPLHADMGTGIVFSTVFFTALIGAAAYVISLIMDKNFRSIPFAADLGIVIAALLLIKIRTHIKTEDLAAIPCRRCGCVTNCFGDMEVTGTYYGIVEKVLGSRKITTKTTQTHYSYGPLGGRTANRTVDVRTETHEKVQRFYDVKHEKLLFTAQCPCCLQAYQTASQRVAESLEGKKSIIYDETSYKSKRY